MAPALSAAFMCGQVFWRVQSSETKEELEKLFARFVSDLVSKEEVCCKPSASPLPEQPPTPLPGPAALTSPLRRQFTAELARIAGIPACMSALEAIRPQLDFVLYAEPYPDADYTDPRLKDDVNATVLLHGRRSSQNTRRPRSGVGSAAPNSCSAPKDVPGSAASLRTRAPFGAESD